MDLERERRFHELLLEALEVPPEARREFLVDACGDDPELLTEVWQAAAPEETSLGDFLQRPALTDDQRAEFVAQICAGIENARSIFQGGPGLNLLRLLSENDRLGALPEIAAQFDELKANTENKIKATLVSASEVDTAQMAKIAAALSAKLGREVELKLELNPALLGGAVIRAKDMVIDGSVQTRLQRLAGSLID